MASDLVRGVQGLFENLRRTPTRNPVWLRVPDERVDESLGEAPLEPRRHYFEVRINRMYLSAQREWLTKYVPVVLAAAEFSYAGETMFAPTLVGPNTIERLGGRSPLGAVVANARIAGPHPFMGGELAISLILFRLDRANVLEPFLDTLEGASGAMDFAAGLVPYVKIAQVVLKGITALTGGDEPRLARYDGFSPVRPGFYALVDPDSPIDVDSLTVTNRELYLDGSPFADGDYVLYSVRRVTHPEVDVTQLPLFGQWQTVLREAAKSSTDDVWTNTKLNWSALIGMLGTSPDLTVDHAMELSEEWKDTMVAEHKRAKELGTLADEPSPLDSTRSAALAALEL